MQNAISDYPSWDLSEANDKIQVALDAGTATVRMSNTKAVARFEVRTANE
jgi:hypothetical protein